MSQVPGNHKGKPIEEISVFEGGPPPFETGSPRWGIAINVAPETRSKTRNNSIVFDSNSIYKAIYRGYNSIYKDHRGPQLHL